MSNKLSFKEYLESKEALLDAVEEVPKTKIEYEVNKYCTLPINESSGKRAIKLKPHNKFFINWLCEDKKDPRAINITFDDNEEDLETDAEEEFDKDAKPVWTNKKLLQWLLNNTRQN